MKRPHARILASTATIIAVLGLSLGTLGTAPASAATWTVTPPDTAFIATQSGNLTLSSGSDGITCTGGSLNGTTGDGSNPAALLLFSAGSESGCTSTGSWSLTLSGGEFSGSSYSGGVTTGSMPGFTLTVSGSDLGLTCSFTLTGATATYANPGVEASDGVLQIDGPVTVSGVTGPACSLSGISNGSTASLNLTYDIPGVTITAS